MKSIAARQRGWTIPCALLAVGCAAQRGPSRDVDSLIQYYTAQPADAFDSSSLVNQLPMDGFTVQSVDFTGAVRHRLAEFFHAPTRQHVVARLALVASDSVSMAVAVQRIAQLFGGAAEEWCATRADGAQDRVRVWRAGKRSGVIVRTPAQHGPHPNTLWEGRLVFVRHGVRPADAGHSISELPCPRVAVDGTVASYSDPGGVASHSPASPAGDAVLLTEHRSLEKAATVTAAVPAGVVAFEIGGPPYRASGRRAERRGTPVG